MKAKNPAAKARQTKKLTPLMASYMEKLSDGDWHRIDKVIGNGLVNRGLVKARPSKDGFGFEYRRADLPQPVEATPRQPTPAPATPRRRRSKTPLIDWIEARVSSRASEEVAQ